MTPEEHELLRRSIALAEENNDILRSIQRSMRIGNLMKVVYWTVIIGSAVGAYYFIQPYLETLMGFYGGAQDQINGVSSVLDSLKSLGS